MTLTQRAHLFTDDGILTRDEVAEWLKVKPRQVERLGVPHLDLGRKTKHYLMHDVLRWLQQRRAEKEATRRGGVVAVRDASEGRPVRRKPWGTSGA